MTFNGGVNEYFFPDVGYGVVCYFSKSFNLPASLLKQGPSGWGGLNSKKYLVI